MSLFRRDYRKPTQLRITLGCLALCGLLACGGQKQVPEESGAQVPSAGRTAPTATAGAAAGQPAATGGAGVGGAVATSSAHAGQPATAGTHSEAGAGNSNTAGSAATNTGGTTGTAGTGSAGQAATNTDTPQPGDLFVAPDGTDSAAGSQSEPTTLQTALTKVAAGHTIFVRAGTYELADQVTIERENSGQDGQPKQLFAYGDEKPVLDFSKEPYGKDSNARGLQINGSYWHIKGLTVFKAADNGIYVAGNHNVIENCVVHGNRDTGLQLGRYASSAETMADWPSDNLILNCESYDNYDAPPGGGENADGFAAKLTVGTGNVFRGCVSHNNIDDGWDLYTKTDSGAIGAVTIDQCVAHHNGTLTDGTTNANGDRNGFKLGGEDIAVGHIVARSVAFANGKDGFTWNSNPGAIHLSNTLAFDNTDGNYRFGDSSTMTQAVFTNNVSVWTKTSSTQSDKTAGDDADGSNCFWNKTASMSKGGITVTAKDFAQPLDQAVVTRASDGSPDLSAFALAKDSPLINAGVVPAQPLPFPASYYKDAPDLGAVEAN
jgi:hypothetical protein